MNDEYGTSPLMVNTIDSQKLVNENKRLNNLNFELWESLVWAVSIIEEYKPPIEAHKYNTAKEAIFNVVKEIKDE